MKSRIAVVALALWLGALPAIVRGQMRVGDKPKLQARAVDGTPITLEAFAGRLVLIDFWATWCGPCMAEAGHMVAIHRQYAQKGLCIIGVSLDRSEATMVRVARDKGFVWPQIYNPATGGEISKQFGVNAIPRTFLIGPDGDLLWEGHPASLDPVLADAFKKHPPRLVDAKVLAAATEALGKAEAAAADGKPADAIRLFAKLPPDARNDASLANRIELLQKNLADHAANALAEAEKLIEQKEFTAALATLKDLSKLNGLPAAVKAAQRTAAVMAMPEAKSQIAAFEKVEREKERAARAAEALAVAQKLQAEKKHENAYAAFKAVITQFTNTSPAETAQAEVKNYEKDPDFLKRANTASVQRKAESMLNMAASYKAAEKYDLARQRFQAVIDQFPNTPFAETAKKELADLPTQ